MREKFQEETTRNPLSRGQIISATSVGSVVAYFITSILSSFHPKLYEFLLISVISLLVSQIIAIALLEDKFKDFINYLYDNWGVLLILTIAALLAVSVMTISSQYPGLFHQEILFMETGRLVIFVGLVIIICTCYVLFSKTSLAIEKIKSKYLFAWVKENLPGLFLAMSFFLVYLTFAETINFPTFRTLDLYFDFDISTWLTRLTEPSVQDIPGIRPVHPAILLFLRPLIWFLSLFLNGDRLHALFLLHALTGALCVLMIWLIVKHITKQKVFALLIAFLLGASASHLILSSMLETYIYSAFGLILFAFLMHSGKTSLQFTLPVGIVVTGITISNFVQTCILYFAGHPRFRLFIRYVLLTVLSILALNYLHNYIFPTARLLIAPSSMDRELGYIHQLDMNSWRSRGRVSLVARAITLYGIVAPTPFILDEELGGKGIPHFRTFKITIGEFHVAGYNGLADITAKFWLVLLIIAFILYIMDFFNSRKSSMLATGMLFCLGFNFILHTFYGDDPLLYSPDWVFALVLFIAHSFKRFADRIWIHFTLLAFLILMIIVNLGLIVKIIQVSAPLYGG